MQTPKFKDSDAVFVSGTATSEPGPGIILRYVAEKQLYQVRMAGNGLRLLVPESCLAAIE